MFTKSAFAVALATFAIGGVIKRDDNRREVIIPQGETLAQFTDAWKAECDKLFYASSGGVYTNTSLVEPASDAGDANVYCSWYTERPTVVYDETEECAEALGVQFVTPTTKKSKRYDERELVVIPQGQTLTQLNEAWTAECHKIVDGEEGTFSSLVEPSPSSGDAYVFCTTYEKNSNGSYTINNYTHQCADALGIQFA